MFDKITPEKAGISSARVLEFINTLEKRGLPMHSILMMKGNDIFAEYYWLPFSENFCHRMYSQTKSFVGVAIGLLEQDGLLGLDDKIHTFFPDKIDTDLPENLKELTVRDMLMMQTCGDTPSWFYDKDPDRTHIYFNRNQANMAPGMRWHYDSPGSQVLSTLVERLSGMSLFDFLKTRIFDHIGTFKTAYMLKTKTDDTFGDSAMLCTTRDVASFARFVMNYGSWQGRQIINEKYMREATSRLADNCESGFDGVFTHGYGYQIWRYGDDGFAFNGMGSQLTICLPKQDFIFTCTADTQGYEEAKALILTALQDIIIDNLGSPLPEDPEAAALCEARGKQLKLCTIKGKVCSPAMKEISGVTYICDDNLAGFKKFTLHFEGKSGRLCYTNAQGDKELAFGLGENAFTKFPQQGYSDDHTGLPTVDHLYDCAVSAAWAEERKLLIKVQVIDKYFGNAIWVFSFKGDKATISMRKHAEAFLDEYVGEVIATKA